MGMKEKLIEAMNETWDENFTNLEKMQDGYSHFEILDSWLSYEGIHGFTPAIVTALLILGWVAPDKKGMTPVSNFTQPGPESSRLSKKIRVGESYHNGTSCYEVRETMPSIGEALLYHPQDDFLVLVHGAALYDTPSGEQLLWNRFTLGDFKCVGANTEEQL